MKAPDLPNKIYFTILDMGSGYVYTPSLDDNGGTKYIRKDALLEWANERLEEFRHIAEISNDVAADGEVDAFEEVIDKLNSM